MRVAAGDRGCGPDSRNRSLLAHRDRWARQLSDFDMGARQKTAEPTDLKTFLDFAAAAGRGWTAEEKNNGRLHVDCNAIDVRMGSGTPRRGS